MKVLGHVDGTLAGLSNSKHRHLGIIITDLHSSLLLTDKAASSSSAVISGAALENSSSEPVPRKSNDNTAPSADVPSAAAAAKSTAVTPDHRAFMEQMMSQYAVNAAALSTGGIALQNRTTLGRRLSLVSKYISDHLVKLSIQVMLSTRIFSMLWVLNCGTMAVSV